MLLRSGYEYRALRTNLRYGELLQRAISRDAEIAAHHDRLRDPSHSASAHGVTPLDTDLGAWSPTSLDPITPSTDGDSGAPSLTNRHLDGSMQPSDASTATGSIAPTPPRYQGGSDGVGVSAQALGDALRSIVGCDDAPSRAPSSSPSLASHASVTSVVPCKRTRRGKRRARNNGQGDSPKRGGTGRWFRRNAKRRRRAKGQDPFDRRHTAGFYTRSVAAKVLPMDGLGNVKYEVDRGAYTGRRMRRLKGDGLWTWEQLKALGFADFEWDGRTTYAILDGEKHIVAVLAGTPTEDDSRPSEQCYGAAVERVARFFEAERSAHEASFTGKSRNHRRGNYAMLSFGVSYGGGQKRPGNLCHSVGHEGIVERMCANRDLGRVAGFGSEMLAAYFPRAYDHMRRGIRALRQRQPWCRPIFRSSAYPTASVNLGPTTVTADHNDCTNYPGLPCSITPFGDFDCDRGGHLYFWDLKLIVRFPPGSTILLSSAGLRHGNIPIQPGEKRYSFTQYCVGGLMRWIAHGFQPAKSISNDERLRLDIEGQEGLSAQLGRLSKIDGLEEDRRWLWASESIRH